MAVSFSKKQPHGEGTETSLRQTLVNPRGYITRPPPADRPVRVYVHGVWDLLHIGHVRFLERAKNTIPSTYLIVGVTEDNDTFKAKGPTVIPGAERSEMMRACRYVDEVIEDCPPVLLPIFMDEYKIDYFGHADDSLQPGHSDPYEFVKKDGKFLVIPRTSGISSSDILTRVLRDRDRYIERQLRSGVSRRVLNIT